LKDAIESPIQIQTAKVPKLELNVIMEDIATESKQQHGG